MPRAHFPPTHYKVLELTRDGEHVRREILELPTFANAESVARMLLADNPHKVFAIARTTVVKKVMNYGVGPEPDATE